MFFEWPAQLTEAYPTEGAPSNGHPGIRVGQTWALLDGATSRVFAIAEHNEKHEVIVDGQPRTIDAWFVGGAWISDTELRDLLGPVPEVLRDAYLLSDVVCPWLAPWSPKWTVNHVKSPLPSYRITASNTAGIWEVIATIEGREVYVGRLHKVGEAWYPSTYDNEPLSAVPFYQIPAVRLLLFWWTEQAELSDKLLGPGHRPGVIPQSKGR